MTIKNIFDEIAAESSTNKKMEILAKYKTNELLKRVLYLANSKRVKFYIKQIPEYPKNKNQYTLEEILPLLDKLSNRELTGNAGINHLIYILTCLNPDDAYIIERIIEKDCKIGMGTTNINKVFPGLLEKTPYMGALPFDEDDARAIFLKSGWAYSQKKMDGRYSNAIIRDGDVELESRQGEPTILTGAKFIKELAQLDDCVLNGELTIDGISRYESNGIIASLVSIGDKLLEGKDPKSDIAKLKKKHGYEYQDALDAIEYTIWDRISVDEYFDMKSNIPYENRFEDLFALMIKNNFSNINLIEHIIAYHYDDAIYHFKDLLRNGHEGTILKDRAGLWKNGKHKHQIKMKLEMDIDLKIVGFNYGTGKNEKLISSLNAESADGKVFTKPTGITEDDMNYITENQASLLGSIVEVKCSGLSKDSSNNYALLHPVFKSFRKDKSTANSFEEIVEIEDMIKGLTKN